MSNQGKAMKGVFIGVIIATVAAVSTVGAMTLAALFVSLSFVKGH